MDFALGMLLGMFIMWAIAKRLQIEWKKEIEQLKDFDTWKEWKNKSE
jgi:type III secretory pathway component EscR